MQLSTEVHPDNLAALIGKVTMVTPSKRRDPEVHQGDDCGEGITVPVREFVSPLQKIQYLLCATQRFAFCHTQRKQPFPVLWLHCCKHTLATLCSKSHTF